jgi:hypothetical protein
MQWRRERYLQLSAFQQERYRTLVKYTFKNNCLNLAKIIGPVGIHLFNISPDLMQLGDEGVN